MILFGYVLLMLCFVLIIGLVIGLGYIDSAYGETVDGYNYVCWEVPADVDGTMVELLFTFGSLNGGTLDFGVGTYNGGTGDFDPQYTRSISSGSLINQTVSFTNFAGVPVTAGWYLFFLSEGCSGGRTDTPAGAQLGYVVGDTLKVTTFTMTEFVGVSCEAQGLSADGTPLFSHFMGAPKADITHALKAPIADVAKIMGVDKE